MPHADTQTQRRTHSILVVVDIRCSEICNYVHLSDVADMSQIFGFHAWSRVALGLQIIQGRMAYVCAHA